MQTALDGLPEGNPYAAEISTAVHRLRRIVDSFLGMTRVDSEALTPQPEWCEMEDILHAATAPLEPELQRHPLQLTGTRDLPLLRADTRLLGQALANVLHNATVHAPNDTPIHLHAALDRGQLAITVHDTGPGLPEGEVDRVFEKFYRAPGARPGGTGLGLPIARGLMRAMKGDLRAANHPDGGAVFTLSLPVESRTSES